MPTDTSVEAYLDGLPAERQGAVRAVRQVVLENLPEGYEECMSFGMIAYVVPLERYPRTYNGQPLMYAALSSRKQHMSLHLMAVYGEGEEAFRSAYAATGKRLDMGKSCIRFTSVEGLALEPVAAAVRQYTVEEFLERYEESRARV